jgi:RimJ/RimL family protein N-acetyltransferase
LECSTDSIVATSPVRTIQGGISIRETARLRLEPITRDHAQDYWVVFQDDAIAEWYAGKPTLADAHDAVQAVAASWATIGFHKWLVYERESGAVVGRGGLSAIPLHAYNGQIRAALPADARADEEFASDTQPLARRWCELGWALCGIYWGRGYAASWLSQVEHIRAGKKECQRVSPDFKLRAKFAIL